MWLPHGVTVRRLGFAGPTSPWIGGLAREFYTRNRQHYGADHSGRGSTSELARGADLLDEAGAGDASCRLPTEGCNQTFNLEPHVAEAIFVAMAKEAGVAVFYSAQVDTVQMAAGSATVESITTTDGRSFAAKVWVDASYEGDLLARAGVSYTIGREGRDDYNETLAGMSAGASSNQFDLAVDPFDAAGNPLPFTALPPQGRTIGSGDSYVQSYNFRLCLTANSSNMVPWPKPTDYKSTDWELLRRYVAACSAAAESGGENGTTFKGHCQIGYPSCNNGVVSGDGHCPTQARLVAVLATI
jgi:hypothetical protein